MGKVKKSHRLSDEAKFQSRKKKNYIDLTEDNRENHKTIKSLGKNKNRDSKQIEFSIAACC